MKGKVMNSSRRIFNHLFLACSLCLTLVVGATTHCIQPGNEQHMAELKELKTQVVMLTAKDALTDTVVFTDNEVSDSVLIIEI